MSTRCVLDDCWVADENRKYFGLELNGEDCMAMYSDALTVLEKKLRNYLDLLQ